MSKLPLVLIVGPTAVGKTEVGIRLAKKIDGEIISGDSMQVYRHMDIGTAKPTRQEMMGIPHYMIDEIDPGEDFSVAVFQNKVENYIKLIHTKNKMPILVGGTGLYVRSVIDSYDFTPPAGDSDRRRELTAISEEFGNERLVEMLRQVDPVSAQRIHLNDTRRLIRAIEVFQTTGRPISDFQYTSVETEPKYNLAYYGLTMERDKLYNRIEQRVDLMMSRGLVDEVRELMEMGYGLQNTSMQAIGYKEIISYLEGEISLAEASELIKRDTRRFAKRQLTWFRHDQRIQWKVVENYSSLEEIANEIAAEVEGLSCQT